MKGLIDTIVTGEKTVEEIEELFEKEFAKYDKRHE
jgi:hypothetical protein